MLGKPRSRWDLSLHLVKRMNLCHMTRYENCFYMQVQKKNNLGIIFEDGVLVIMCERF